MLSNDQVQNMKKSMTLKYTGNNYVDGHGDIIDTS